MASDRATGAGFDLLDLIEPPRWQRLQDHFSSVLGVAIRTVSPSHLLRTSPSWPAGVETERAIALLKIGEELDGLLPEHALPQTISSVTTTLGVTYAVVPVRATSEQAIAYFVVGPMIVGPREEELQFRQRLQAMGRDAPALWPLILSLKLFTFSGIRSALNLLEEVGTAIVQLAYQSKRLASILPGASTVDQAVVTYHTNRVLQALLDAATTVTKADGGSVMVYDAREDALRIRAAHGLSDEVIATTRLQRGEGIAGLAALERSILLVDDQQADPRLKSRMQRKELVSSLVASLTTDVEQEPVGVLNLRTGDPKKRFTTDQLEVLRQLLDLAGAALSSLRFAFTPAPSGTSSPQP